MAYEDAPATALVAQSCCICGRPLVKAESIASGIGPDCAERTGLGQVQLAPEVAAEINQLVHDLAVLQKSPKAVPLLVRLRTFPELARVCEAIEARIAKDVTEVRLVLDPAVNRLRVELPYMDRSAFLHLSTDLRRVPGIRLEARDNGKGRVPVLPNATASVLALGRVLARHLPGKVVQSPNGLGIIPSESEFEAKLGERKTEVAHAAA